MKRTSRVDVALAVICTGVGFLAWALISGISWMLLNQQSNGHDATQPDVALPRFLSFIQGLSNYGGYVIDILGLAMMCVCLLLIFFAHRQLISISWAWMALCIQLILTVLGGVFVAAAMLPSLQLGASEEMTLTEILSMISLPVVAITAVIVWSIFAFYMFRQPEASPRRRLSRMDSFKSNWK